MPRSASPIRLLFRVLTSLPTWPQSWLTEAWSSVFLCVSGSYPIMMRTSFRVGAQSSPPNRYVSLRRDPTETYSSPLCCSSQHTEAGKVTFAKLALKNIQIPYTSNVIERLMGEISKRCKHKWMHWSTESLENILQIILVRYANPQFYKQFWKTCIHPTQYQPTLTTPV